MSYPSDLVRTKNWGTETLTDTDLEGQLDLIIDWAMALVNETSGHKHDATENEGPKISLTGSVSGTLPLANGGTGETSLAALGNLFYPVGSYYFNDSDNTNPGTLLGFGTWVAVEEEVLVGIKAGGTFDTLGTVLEGEETHALTEAELASHDHNINAKQAGAVGTNALLTHADTGSPAQDVNTDNTGSGTAHNNIQPSRVVYMWRRTV